MISPRAVVSITIIVTVFTSILAAITILTTILVTILIPTLVNIIINNVTSFFIVVVNIHPALDRLDAGCCPFIPSLECSGNPALLMRLVGVESPGRAERDLASSRRAARARSLCAPTPWPAQNLPGTFQKVGP